MKLSDRQPLLPTCPNDGKCVVCHNHNQEACCFTHCPACQSDCPEPKEKETPNDRSDPR